MPLTLNGTTGIAGANGSASTPAVQGEDTNTGVFFPAADTVAVATGGSERMRVNSSGNVGIGTTSPGDTLDVNGGIFVTPTLTDNTGTANIGFQSNRSSSTQPRGSLSAIGSSASTNYQALKPGYLTLYSAYADIALNADTSTTIQFWTGGSERARFLSDGAFLVGKTTAGQITTNGAELRSNYSMFAASNTGTAPTMYIGANGGSGNLIDFYYGSTRVGTIITNGTTTAYNTSSDYRLKENVQPMQDALAKIAQLNPVTYTWKADGSDGQGFIAHELQAVVPDCVTGEKDAVDAEGNPQYQGVDTSFLVATLVKAVQELKAEVDSLKAQLEAAQ
jgi:hypothetical protein